MKKLNTWFNGLPAQQQRRYLIGFAVVFSLLLIASFWLPLHWNTGQITPTKIK